KVSFATSTTCASDLSLAGGEFYSVTRCCQHLFFSAFDREDRTVNQALQPRLINSFWASMT
ncbi:MAG: hypothetical protein ACRC4F_00400, partial [Pseudomonas sp.]